MVDQDEQDNLRQQLDSAQNLLSDKETENTNLGKLNKDYENKM